MRHRGTTDRRSAPRRTPRRLAAVAGSLCLVLVALTALAWWGQRSLIYHPGVEPPPVDQSLPGAEETIVTTADGLDLTAWFLAPDEELDRGQAVLYLPGNAGDRSARAGTAQELSDRGFGVLLLDYRGFGGNPGSPSEEGLAEDARAGVETLEEHGYAPRQLIYLGESLGTGVAARLHQELPPAGLLLRSPFTELAELGQQHYPMLPVRLLLRDEFTVTERVRGTEVPTSVIYGDDDDVVPAEQSREVAAAAGDAVVEEITMSGAGHNDPVMFGPEVADAALRLAEEAE